MCIAQNIIFSPSLLVKSDFLFQALSKGDAQTTEQWEQQEKRHKKDVHGWGEFISVSAFQKPENTLEL